MLSCDHCVDYSVPMSRDNAGICQVAKQANTKGYLSSLNEKVGSFLHLATCGLEKGGHLLLVRLGLCKV